jgi:hypothetical protein
MARAPGMPAARNRFTRSAAGGQRDFGEIRRQPDGIDRDRPVSLMTMLKHDPTPRRPVAAMPSNARHTVNVCQIYAHYRQQGGDARVTDL